MLGCSKRSKEVVGPGSCSASRSVVLPPVTFLGLEPAPQIQHPPSPPPGSLGSALDPTGTLTVGDGPLTPLPCLPASCSGLSVLIRVRLELRRHQRAGHTVPRIFQAVARRHPERLALVDAGSGACWTFAQLDAYSNAVGHLFCQLGFAPGDVVAIFAEGRPEFVGLWLGLAKAGMVAALLNVNLRREPLVFCLGTSGAKALIYGGELAAGEAGTPPPPIPPTPAGHGVSGAGWGWRDGGNPGGVPRWRQ